MRLWHTALLNVLPKEQLVAQWRELSAIAGSIDKNGTPNHILVNFVLDYDWDHFINYAGAVRKIMTSRGYRTMDKVWEKIKRGRQTYDLIPLDKIYKEKMDSMYLIICYYNLREKYLCGGIKKEDWDKIFDKYLEETYQKNK